MRRLTNGQKALRHVAHLLGVRSPEITRILARHGVIAAARELGWKLVRQMLGAPESPPPSPSAVRRASLVALGIPDAPALWMPPAAPS